MSQKYDREPAESATHVLAEFYPQVWGSEGALTGIETRTFIVPIEEAVDEDGRLVDDCCEASDVLCQTENAPKKARLWQGPFFVKINATLGSEDPEDVIQEF
jgi:hypothetical protein